MDMAVRYESSVVISEHVKLFVKLRKKAFEALPWAEPWYSEEDLSVNSSLG